jgi:hypothetical protein
MKEALTVLIVLMAMTVFIFMFGVWFVGQYLN